MGLVRRLPSSCTLGVVVLMGCVLEHSNAVDNRYVPAEVTCTFTPVALGAFVGSNARSLFALAPGEDGALVVWIERDTRKVVARHWTPSGVGAPLEVAPGASASRVVVAALGDGWVACWSSLLQSDNTRPLECRAINPQGVPFGPVATVAEHHGHGGIAIAAHRTGLWAVYLAMGDQSPMILARLDSTLQLLDAVELPDPTGVVRDVSLTVGETDGLLLVHDSSNQPLAVTLDRQGAWLASVRIPGGEDTATGVTTATTSEGLAVGALALYTSSPQSPSVCSVTTQGLVCEAAAPGAGLVYGGVVEMAAYGEEVVLGAVAPNRPWGSLTWLSSIAGRLYDVRFAHVQLSPWFRLAGSGEELLLLDGVASGSDAVELTLASLSCR